MCVISSGWVLVRIYARHIGHVVMVVCMLHSIILCMFVYMWTWPCTCCILSLCVYLRTRVCGYIHVSYHYDVCIYTQLLICRACFIENPCTWTRVVRVSVLLCMHKCAVQVHEHACAYIVRAQKPRTRTRVFILH